MNPLPVRCPECWAEVGKPGCPCGQTTILKRDLQRLGSLLHEAERQATYWRRRALLLESHAQPSDHEETT